MEAVVHAVRPSGDVLRVIERVIHVHAEFQFVVFREGNDLADADIEIIHRPHWKDVSAGRRVDAGAGTNVVRIRVIYQIGYDLVHAVPERCQGRHIAAERPVAARIDRNAICRRVSVQIRVHCALRRRVFGTLVNPCTAEQPVPDGLLQKRIRALLKPRRVVLPRE